LPLCQRGLAQKAALKLISAACKLALLKQCKPFSEISLRTANLLHYALTERQLLKFSTLTNDKKMFIMDMHRFACSKRQTKGGIA